MSMTLEEVDAELVSRGFNGFDPQQRYRYINWAYHHVARHTRWAWEITWATIDFAAGDVRKLLPPTFSSMKFAAVTTDPYRITLNPVDEQSFTHDWLTRDLAGTAERANPEMYYVWTEGLDNYLYLLPPPSVGVTVQYQYYRKVVDLAPGPGTNTPLTPDEYDEAIVLASLVRCHTRANEPDHALNARAQLEEQFGLSLDQDEDQMEEEIERVSPYPWP